MDEALNCDRIVMINEGRIVAIGSPGEIIAEACPGEPEATLNEAFIRLMSKNRRGSGNRYQGNRVTGNRIPLTMSSSCHR